MTVEPPLHQRFPRLRDLAYCGLGTLPTPASPLQRASSRFRREVWVKRDDLTSTEYGGTKVRKLEWVFGAAQHERQDAIVTVGAEGSHHVLACGAFGRAHGMRVRSVLTPQPPSPYVSLQREAMRAVGVEIHRGSPTSAPAQMLLHAELLSLRRRRPRIVGPGGTGPVGNVGLVNAGLELADQVDQGLLPEPRLVVCAAGSGGIAVGLAIGLAAAGLTTRVRAVRVGPKAPLNRWALRAAVSATLRHLMRHDRRFPEVGDLAFSKLEVDHGFAGPGYGRADDLTNLGAAWAEEDELTVETTYTARAFAALADVDATEGPILYWHTCPGPDQARRLCQR